MPRPLRSSAAALVTAAVLALLPAAPSLADSPPTPSDGQSTASVAAPAFNPLPVPLSPDLLATSNYGMSVFIWDNPQTTNRDLTTLQEADFGWQKTLFEWRDIEGACKGCFDWTEADRVVAASNAAGIRIIARVDYQPTWARADHTTLNARPDNFQDYADFVQALADRYQTGSPYGHIDAIEVWNEPNLEREWGAPISASSAADYVQMLSMAYQAVKSVDPSIQVISAGLSPTGVNTPEARPDDQYLQWMYNAGLSGNYDVLGVHGNAQAPDPTAAPGSLPGFTDPSFYFRRIEQLRSIEVLNGDEAVPVWLLEYGWTSDPVDKDYSWYAVSEDKKGANILAAMQYARANWPWMGVMTLWAMPDPTWQPTDERYWWAVANPDGTPRSALVQIINAAQANLLP